MRRATLLKKLNAYTPTPTEVPTKKAMIAFAQQHADCFERSLEEGHFTASVWLLNKEGNKALLMHHTKLDKWFQLGGHCDGDPDITAVALKEAQEESGIQGIKLVSDAIFDIDMHTIPARKDIPEHIHYDIRFLAQVTSDEVIKKNHESQELRWIGTSPNELPNENPSVKRMFDKWVALRN